MGQTVLNEGTARELACVLNALRSLRVPAQRSEYDLHALAGEALDRAGVPWEHELPLGKGCRADIQCGGVTLELKRGKPRRAVLLRQLERYAANTRVCALVVVSERNVDLPDSIGGKPLRCLCLNRLWGIAL